MENIFFLANNVYDVDANLKFRNQSCLEKSYAFNIRLNPKFLKSNPRLIFD